MNIYIYMLISIEPDSAQAAPVEAPAPPAPPGESLVIYGIDDSALMRRMLDTLATTVLGCRKDRCAMLGATMDEVESFIDVALG